MPEITIIRILLASACLLAVMPFAASTSAHAAPFCIVEGGEAGYESCAFVSMQQCQASAEGSRAVCMANPREAAIALQPDPASVPVPTRKKK